MDKEIIIDIENPKDNDLISRQALLKLMGEEPFNWTDSDGELQAVEDYRNFRNMVEQLSSVNPQEPKTGYWTRELIRNEKGGCIGAKMICSRCDNDNKHDEYMNYCPNCGARMFEPKESEE